MYPLLAELSAHDLEVAETLIGVIRFLLIFLAARALAEVLVRLSLPTIVGELLAGVVIGASGFHLLIPPSAHTELNQGLVNVISSLASIPPEVVPDVYFESFPSLQAVATLGLYALLFLTGLESEIMDLKNNGYNPKSFIDKSPELKEVIRLIEIGHFSNGDKDLFKPLLNSLTGNDPFFVMADFEEYLNKQDEVSNFWNNKKAWNKMALLNTSRSGYFSSDRSIREYCESIWKVSPMPVEITCDIEEVTT